MQVWENVKHSMLLSHFRYKNLKCCEISLICRLHKMGKKKSCYDDVVDFYALQSRYIESIAHSQHSHTGEPRVVSLIA